MIMRFQKDNKRRSKVRKSKCSSIVSEIEALTHSSFYFPDLREGGHLSEEPGLLLLERRGGRRDGLGILLLRHSRAARAPAGRRSARGRGRALSARLVGVGGAARVAGLVPGTAFLLRNWVVM